MQSRTLKVDLLVNPGPGFIAVADGPVDEVPDAEEPGLTVVEGESNALDFVTNAVVSEA